MPEAPFDPGRFSVDQITLSELEERSGLDFGRLKDFDVLAAQPVPKSLLRGARLRLPLTGVQETVLWAPDPEPVRFLTLATLSLEMCGNGLATGALNDREFGHGQTAAIGSKAVRAGAFIKDSSLDQAEATKRPWRNPIDGM